MVTQKLMKAIGKIVGAVLGGLINGWLGVIIGLMLGHFFDMGLFDPLLNKFNIYRHSNQLPQIIFKATFELFGYLAEANDHVDQSELDFVEKIMQQMGLSSHLRQDAMRYFRKGRAHRFDIDATLEELKQACRHAPYLLIFFLEIQFEITTADGTLDLDERNALLKIARQLGLEEELTRLINFYEQQRESFFKQENRTVAQLQSAYDLFEIAPNTALSEVKKVYRRLMNRNHPDKLIAKGFPPEMIKLATKKTQQIKEAYELIKKKS